MASYPQVLDGGAAHAGQAERLGCIGLDADGNAYRYAKLKIGSNIAEGVTLGTQAIVSLGTITAAAKVGDQVIQAAFGNNDVIGGLFVITEGTKKDIGYIIDASKTFIRISAKLKNAYTVAADITILALGRAVPVGAATKKPIEGVACADFTAKDNNKYAWLQAKGLGKVLKDASGTDLTANGPVRITAAGLAIGGSSGTQIGTSLFAENTAVTGDHLVWAQLDIDTPQSFAYNDNINPYNQVTVGAS